MLSRWWHPNSGTICHFILNCPPPLKPLNLTWSPVSSPLPFDFSAFTPVFLSSCFYSLLMFHCLCVDLFYALIVFWLFSFYAEFFYRFYVQHFGSLVFLKCALQIKLSWVELRPTLTMPGSAALFLMRWDTVPRWAKTYPSAPGLHFSLSRELLQVPKLQAAWLLWGCQVHSPAGEPLGDRGVQRHAQLLRQGDPQGTTRRITNHSFPWFRGSELSGGNVNNITLAIINIITLITLASSTNDYGRCLIS